VHPGLNVPTPLRGSHEVESERVEEKIKEKINNQQKEEKALRKI